MNKLLLSLLLPLLSAGAWSQDVIYRCGNEYTNNASQAKAKGCKPVDGGHVTVIHGGGAKPPAARASSGSASTPAAASSGPAAAKVDNNAQRARDADARAILTAELTKSQEKLAQLKQEYNDGNPQRTALELRNPQGYLERVEQLKASIARQESDVAGIRREIDRLPAPSGAN